MTAVIVGVRGQDGSLLKDYLERQGFKTIGIDKNSITYPDGRKEGFSIFDRTKVNKLISEAKPFHIYYLAGFHHSSEEETQILNIAETSYQVHVYGLLNFFEAMTQFSRESRLFYAGSSLMYGNPGESRVSEKTPFMPDCIYGITKLVGYHTVRLFRNKYGLFAVTGILFNHESALRKPNFFSKKVIDGAIRIKKGVQKELIVGSLSAKNDWGYAPDYLEAMYRMLMTKKPEDYIIATGELHTAEEFVEIVFKKLGMNYKDYVREDTTIIKRKKPFFCGDYSKIYNELGWRPTLSFKEMVERLVDQELKNYD